MANMSGYRKKLNTYASITFSKKTDNLEILPLTLCP